MTKATADPVLMKTMVDAFQAHIRYQEVNFNIHQYRAALLSEGESDTELLTRVVQSIGKAVPAIKNSMISANKSSQIPGVPRQIYEDLEIYKLWCDLTLDDLDLLDSKITQMLMGKGDEVRSLSDALSSYYEGLGIEEDFTEYMEDEIEEEEAEEDQEEDDENDPFASYNEQEEAEEDQEEDDEDAPIIKPVPPVEPEIIKVTEEEAEAVADEEYYEETSEEEPEYTEETEEEVADEESSYMDQKDAMLIQMNETLQAMEMKLNALASENAELKRDNDLLQIQIEESKPKPADPAEVMNRLKKSGAVRTDDSAAKFKEPAKKKVEEPVRKKVEEPLFDTGYPIGPTPDEVVDQPNFDDADEVEDEASGVKGKASEVISKAKGAVRKTATKSPRKKKTTKRKTSKKPAAKKEAEVKDEAPKEDSE